MALTWSKSILVTKTFLWEEGKEGEDAKRRYELNDEKHSRSKEKTTRISIWHSAPKPLL